MNIFSLQHILEKAEVLIDGFPSCLSLASFCFLPCFFIYLSTYLSACLSIYLS